MMNSITLEPASSLKTTIQLLKGDEVFNQFQHDDFLKDWDELIISCPWATVYQSKAFVANYYHIYKDVESPVLIKAEEGGKLIGLLTLSRHRTGKLLGAGGYEAEYHTWLSLPDKGEWFIVKALQEVRKNFPHSDIQLKYLPGNTPLGWLAVKGIWQRRCLIRDFQQPVMCINKDYIANELRKKNRREKLNRLKRLGDLKFERVTDYGTFLSLIDELATQYDFRKGAMFNKLPFRHNPRKKALLLALFKQNLLHVTILKLNDEIIASNVGAIGDSIIHLQGINSHSPFYAKHSPGIIHFLMLGESLANEGFNFFDLTPGGDIYKETLATEHHTAYELRIPSDYGSYLAIFIRNKIWEILDKSSINPKAFKHKIKRYFHALTLKLQFNLRSTMMSPVGRAQQRKLSQKKYVRYYSLTKRDQVLANNKIVLKHNSLNDLLLYKPLDTRWEFLEDAMKRFEFGQHAFTLSHNDMLFGCAWISPVKDILQLSASDYMLNQCTNAIAIIEFYYNFKEDSTQQWKDFLIAVIQESCKMTGKEQVFAVASASNKSLQQVFIDFGFTNYPDDNKQ